MKVNIKDKSAKKMRDMIARETIFMYSIVFAYVLADKYGNGKKRIQQILKTVQKIIEEVYSGDISLEEMKDMLKEEYDIDFICRDEVE